MVWQARERGPKHWRQSRIKNIPKTRRFNLTYVPTLRALAALDRNDAPKAHQSVVEANRNYEFGVPPLAFIHFYGNMYLCVRGLAYMAMHRDQDAAAEFSRLLAQRGLAAGDPVDALARRQLARATKTQAAYKDLLTLWKNADPGLPILKEARAEQARLP